MRRQLGFDPRQREKLPAADRLGQRDRVALKDLLLGKRELVSEIFEAEPPDE